MSIQTALEFHLAGRLSEAETAYLAVLDAEPRNADALYFLGAMARDVGQPDIAAQYLARAIEASPANAMYYNALGNVFKDSGRCADAVAWYRQALLHKPDYVEALLNLGNALQQEHLLDDAIVCYRQALTIRAGSCEVHNDMGVALMTLGRLDEAVGSFTQALAHNPGYTEAYNNLGVVLKNQGKLDDAIVCYQRAVSIKPDYAKALFNLGAVYSKKKDYARAMHWYRASLDIDPNQVEAHQNVALILLDEGRLEEAKMHRDLAYRRQSIFFDCSPNPVRTVLVLWAAGKGNVPIEFLFPTKTNNLITWMMEYATEEQLHALPDYDLVFNAIGDADVTGPTRASVARFLAACDKPVLNSPLAVARTARDQIPTLFAPIPDVVTPLTMRFATAEFKDRLLAMPHVHTPVLVRPSSSHGGDHLVKVDTLEQLRALVLFNAEAYYATNYHDYRSADGCFRKYRMIFVDREPHAYHLAISEHWMVHYETAGMTGEAWKRAEEAVFLADPAAAIGPRAMAAVRAIGRMLDLDYGGVDFSVLPDGRVLVFEANATMLAHPEPENTVLSFKNPHVRRIFDAFEAYLVRRLAGQTGGL